jgi:hypothetical protein
MVDRAVVMTEEVARKHMIGTVVAREEIMAREIRKVVEMEEDTEALVAAIVMVVMEVAVTTRLLDVIVMVVVIIPPLAVMAGVPEAIATTPGVAMARGTVEEVAMGSLGAATAAEKTTARSHTAGAEAVIVMETVMVAANGTHRNLSTPYI